MIHTFKYKIEETGELSFLWDPAMKIWWVFENYKTVGIMIPLPGDCLKEELLAFYKCAGMASISGKKVSFE